MSTTPIRAPELGEPKTFTDPKAAVAELTRLYEASTSFLRDRFAEVVAGERPNCRYRAFYPEIRLTTTSFAKIDNRLSFGHVAEPGVYSTNVTRPDLFEKYLTQQIKLITQNHDTFVEIGLSDTPIPLHFAMTGEGGAVPHDGALTFPLRDVFDVPNLATTNDDIVNGYGFKHEDGSGPLAPFTAQRIDYSLARLQHYTATAAEHFQNHVLFTNYQFYME
ncbi:MAG: AMP nucleosidase, partial [Polaromonas sp.]